jgi:hypothetical protein
LARPASASPSSIWESADDDEKAVVNALLADTHASPWLTRWPT